MNRLLPLLLAALLLAGCKESPSPAAQPPADPLAVTAPESLAPQLRIETVGKAPVADILRVAGRIDFDEARVARIGATVTGRVTELQAALGDPVKAGDTLAQLHSTELGNAQLAYLKARAHAELTARST